MDNGLLGVVVVETLFKWVTPSTLQTDEKLCTSVEHMKLDPCRSLLKLDLPNEVDATFRCRQNIRGSRSDAAGLS